MLKKSVLLLMSVLLVACQSQDDKIRIATKPMPYSSSKKLVQPLKLPKVSVGVQQISILPCLKVSLICIQNIQVRHGCMS